MFGFFRRRPPIRDLNALADFIDENAAFVTQKGIFEYSRARAGHYSKVLFNEAGFKDAVEQSRWRVFPLGLAMVGEAADGLLRPLHPDARKQFDMLRALVLSVFDRYPAPAGLDEIDWKTAREELARRLDQVGLHPPKRAADIPATFARAYFELMPIHEKLRGRDFQTVHNYLRVTLCNIQDELANRLDTVALTDELRSAAA